MIFKVLTIVFALALTSCAIEVGGEDTPQIADAGIYLGTITPLGGTVDDAMAIISSADDVAIVERVASGAEAFLGARSDNSLTGTLYASYAVAATAEITTVSGNEIRGTYDSSLGGGTFSLFALTTLYSRSADLSKLVGIWVDSTFLGAVGETTWAILPNGSFTVSTPNACSATGNFYTIDITKNEYSIIMNATDCGSFDGVHSGLATLSDSSDVSQEDTLSVIFANGVVGGIFEPIKQP